MTAFKNLVAGVAVTVLCATPAFAQVPFGAWAPAPAMNCQNGVCRPAGAVNTYGANTLPLNCQNGVCRPVGTAGNYGTASSPMICQNGVCRPAGNANAFGGVPMNCQNGVCTPASHNLQATMPAYAPAVSGVPTNAGNSPFYTPNVANTYYGAPQTPAPAFSNQNYGLNIPANMSGIAQLPAWEQEAALKQRVCPVSGDLLGSRGVPVRTVINGRSVYVCCQNCHSNGNVNSFSNTYSNDRPWLNTPAPHTGYSVPNQAANPNYVLY